MSITLRTTFQILLLAIGTLLASIIVKAYRNPLRHIPGPLISRFTHLRLKLAVITGQRIHYIQALHERYGSFIRISPNEVSIIDPAAFAQIYCVKPSLGKNKWYLEAIGGGQQFRPTLFTMPDAKSHTPRRKLFGKLFSKTHVRGHWEPHIRQQVQLTVSKMRSEAAQRGGSVDVLKWFTLMASDVSSHLMFGESFHALEGGEMNEFMRYLTQAFKGGVLGSELPLVKAIGRYLPFRTPRELFNTHDFLAEYAEVAVRNLESQRNSANLFTAVQEEAEKGERLDELDVKLEAIVLFVAGTNTTAITLTYLIWTVLSRPQLREELEKEVSSLLEEGYTDPEVEELPLLNAVIEETLRLYGAAPGTLPRDVPIGGLDLGVYHIPHGNIVGSQAFSLHRNPDLWSDPLAFNPYRWIDTDGSGKDGKVSAAAQSVVNPFGSGPRTCLGQHIAFAELRLMTAEFFRQCPGARLAPSTTPESMELENFFLVMPKAHRCEVMI